MGLTTLLQALRGEELQEYLPAIENWFDLSNVVCLRKGGHNVWAFINFRGGITQFSFSATFLPLHENETETHATTMEGLLSVLKGLEVHEKLTFSTRVFSEVESVAIREYPNDAAKLLGINHHVHKQKLVEEKQRKQVKYRIDKTYTVDGAAIDSDNSVEKLFSKLIKQWESLFSREQYEQEYAELIAMLTSAHRAGVDFEKTLVATLKLGHVSLLTGQELWKSVSEYFSRETGALPYYLYVDLDDPRPTLKEFNRRGEELTGTPFELTSQLLTDENFPRPHQDYIWLPGRQKYCAVLGFEDIPDDFATPQNKYCWLWNSLISNSQVSDYEIVTQYSYASIEGSRKSLRDYTKQQIASVNKNGQSDQVASETAQEAIEGQRMIVQGDYPVYVGTAILVYGEDLNELRDKISYISKGFIRPTKLFREADYAWRIWLQTLPIKMELLFRCDGFITGDYRLSVNATAALGLCNLIGIVSPPTGVEFISIRGGIPFCASLDDEFGSPRHAVVYGRTGSGKSVLVGQYLVDAAFNNHQITTMDLVNECTDNEDSQKTSSTYSTLIKYLGGTEFDPSQESSNLLEAPNFSGFSDRQREERLDAFSESIEALMQALVLDGVTDTSLSTQIEFLLNPAISRFYKDPEILKRIDQAQKYGIGSQDWKGYPTLTDFYDRITYDLVQNDDDNQRQAVNFIRSALMSWIESAMGRQIAQPSSVDFFSPSYLQFSCQKPSSEKKARILGLMVCTIAQRRALQVQRSLVFIDEFSYWGDFPGLSKYIGVQTATARKSGVSVILATQDPVIIETTAGSAKIRSNLSLRISGRTNGDDITHYQRIHRTPEHLIAQNTAATFKADNRRCTSQWLVDDDGTYTHGRYFAPPILIGLLANNRNQVTARDKFFERYENPLEAAAKWGAHFQACTQQGKSLEDF
jgi:hypothetical protein